MTAHPIPPGVHGASPETGADGGRAGDGPWTFGLRLVRERFASMKNAAIDDAMAKGDTWARGVGNGNQGVMLDDIPKLIDVLGLKIVEKSRICITTEQRDQYEAYRVLAAAHLRPSSPKLEEDWDK